MVVHRANIARIEPMVELALSLGASRVEIAHVQYYGWALKNRAALMPSREQVERAVREVEALRAKHRGRIVIDAVVPDYYARFPSLASAAGAAARSMSPRPAACCRAMRRRSFPGWSSGMCTSIRLATSGDPRPLSWRSSRHRLDAGAVQKLRAARAGFRRLPLPGLPDCRRRARRRSGLPPLAQHGLVVERCALATRKSRNA